MVHCVEFAPKAGFLVFWGILLMKRLLLLAAAVVAVSAGNVMANDGQLSNDTLAKMGLSNMQSMSDEAGMEVRGLYAVSYSNAISFAPNSTAYPSGPSANSGANFAGSFSKSVSIRYYGFFPVPVSFATAGGFAYSRGF
jgi:hypothetical protein